MASPWRAGASPHVESRRGIASGLGVQLEARVVVKCGDEVVAEEVGRKASVCAVGVISVDSAVVVFEVDGE